MSESSRSSNLPDAKIHKNDNMNLRISSPNLPSQHSCITIISVNPKPDTIRAHLVSSTPKTNMELSIHVKNLLQIFILIALGIYWVELICELNRLFFLLCWLFSKTVSCSHAGYPLLPRASYPKRSETLMPGTFSLIISMMSHIWNSDVTRNDFIY